MRVLTQTVCRLAVRPSVGRSCICQIFNEFNARSITNSWNIVKGLKNPMFLGVIVFTVLTQFLIVQEGGSFTRSVCVCVCVCVCCVRTRSPRARR